MNNKTKKLLLKISSITLAAMLCLTSINANVIFPVNAEGEDTDITETTEEPGTTSDPVEPAEGETTEPAAPETTPEAEPEAQPEETPAPEEQPTQAETEEELPATMSMARLMAAPKAAGNIEVVVKDTQGNNLQSDKTINDGWIKEQYDNGTIDHEITGEKNYSFAGAFVGDTPCVYIAKIGNDVYYSSDGVSAVKLPDGQSIELRYREYFTITAEDIVNPAFGTVTFTDSELAYEKDAKNTDQPKLTKTRKIIENPGDTVRTYADEEFMWSVVPGKNPDTDIKAYVKNITSDLEDVTDYGNGKTFYSQVIKNSSIAVEFASKESFTVTYNSDATASISPITKPIGTNSVEFDVSLTGTIKSRLQTVIVTIDGKDYSVGVPTSDGEKTTIISDSYEIKITAKINTFLGGVTSGNYKFTITSLLQNQGIVDDIAIAASGNQLQPLTIISSFNPDKVEIYKQTISGHGNRSDLQQIENGNKATLNPAWEIFGIPINWTTQTNYYCKPTIGYYVETPQYSGTAYTITSIDTPSDVVIDGITNSFNITYKDGSWLDERINFTVMPIQATATFDHTDPSDSFTIESRTPVTIAKKPSSVPDGKLFVGWMLDGDTTKRIYTPGDQIIFDKSNWNLGTPSDDGTKTTFNFTPAYAEADEIYTIQHFKQNEDGSYPTDATDTDTGYSPNTTGEVTAIPKQYEGYTVDYSQKGTIASIRLTKGKPEANNNVLKLYYKKNIEYASYTVTHNVSGSLADTTKQFEFKVTAEKADANKYFHEEYFTDPANGWTSESGKYTKTFSLKHGESNTELSNVPVTNTKYTFKQTTKDNFYTTTSAINGTDVTGKESVVHENPAKDMAHTVAFTNTAREEPATGNDFDNYAYMELLSLAAAACLLFMIIRLVRRYYI